MLKELEDLISSSNTKKNSNTVVNSKKINYGIKCPLLKNIAKKLVKENKLDFLYAKHNSYEEDMIYMYMLTFLKDKDLVYKLLDSYVSKFDNWSVCDTLSSIKIIDKNREFFYNLVLKYKNSCKEFEQRFCFVMMLSHYMNIDYFNKAYKLLDEIKPIEYYSKMGAAWLISYLVIFDTFNAINYLKNSNLDKWIYNKGIQKSIESFRVDKDTKKILKTLRK